MRLIDADKADVERISCFYGSECRLGDVQEWLDEQPTVSPYEWISVEDRLPEKKGQYLIFTTIYFVPDHVGDEDHYDGIELSRFFPTYGFTSENGLYAKFWMPLPEPPTEKEK